MNTKQQTDINLISYCGFYCGECPKFKKDECEGCKGETAKCAVGYKACKVRPCCLENAYSSCADCEKYSSVKECQIYNPLLIRFGQFITRTNRRKGIEMIQKKGELEFVAFMADKKWVTVKS
ncbi:MAG: DUF3795 domain-containing protein [Bacteroidales bacterium]|nr:DUF3795 domain-containing protein [Bacteroidales bacterium]